MAIIVGVDGPSNTVDTPGNHAGRAGSAALAAEAPRQPPVCRFFGKGAGCRAGDQCRFRHPAPLPASGARQGEAGHGRGRGRGMRSGQGRPPPPAGPRDADSGDATLQGPGRGSRGAPGAGTFRRAQIEALLKAAQWTVKRLCSERGETAFAVEMEPSDPDFPFEVSRLYLALVVPAAYPPRRSSDALLAIEVASNDIPAGIKRNIETGFADNVRNTVKAAIDAGNPEDIPSLVDYLQWLDRNLEALMKQRPAATIKFTAFSAAKAPGLGASAAPGTPANHRTSSRQPSAPLPAASALRVATRPCVGRPMPSAPEDPHSRSRTESGDGDTTSSAQLLMELGQLERRFRSSYSVVRKTPAEGTVVRLSIAPTDPDVRSYDIAQMTCTISIARSYPQTPARPDGHEGPMLAASLALDENSILSSRGEPTAWRPAAGRAAYLDYICRRFNEHVAAVPEASLLHHLNWLDRQLVSILANPLPAQVPSRPATAAEQPATSTGEHHAPAAQPSKAADKARLFGDIDEDKPWIMRIPREAGLPTAMAALALGSEGSVPDPDDDSTSGDSAEELEDSGEPGATEWGNDGGAFPKPARRGIELRLGAAGFTNVSLAHCHSLNIAVRCARCKGSVELKGIVPTVRADKDHQMWRACDTCSTVLGVRFRPDWMFAESTTVGYLDCSGCAPTDLLPSKFTLACEACAMNGDEGMDGDDQQQQQQRCGAADGAIGTVGIAANTVLGCRVCYARMGVHLQEPQFVQLQRGVGMGGSASTAQISQAVARSRKTKISKREELARLGVVPGQPLPDHGACKHFRRSNRWLRFPCCGKAYPCVTCHDDKEDHDHEYAQSMLCGHCAKEQRIAHAQQTGLCSGCGAQVFKHVDGYRAFWQGGTGVRDHTRMSRKDPKKYQGLGKTVAQKKVATPKK